MLARVILILIGLALPFPVLAGNVNLSLNASGQYDTNAGRDDGDEADDLSFRFAPRIRVDDQIGKFGYDVKYTPTYQKFVELDDFDKLSHFAGGSLNYQLGNRTSLSLTENFKFTQSVNQESLGADVDDISFSPQPETERADVFTNVASFVARHTFTPRVSGQFTLTHQYFDSDARNASNSESLAGLTSLSYAAGARDRVGFGGGVTFQQFDGNAGQSASDSYTYRVFVSWLHTFGQNTELNIRVGPALIASKQKRPDPEGVDVRYPHLDVTQDGSVAQVYARLGLATPARVTDLTGDPNDLNSRLDDDVGLIIPAGSILVPDPDTCSFTEVSSSFGISPSNCSFSRIARPGLSVPNSQEDQFVAAIQSNQNGLINFTFPVGADPGSTNSSTITYFGEVSLKHRWTATLSSSLLYSRSDSAASSLGSSSVADRVTFDTKWNPNKKLNVTLRADWVQRKNANEITNSVRVVDPAETVFGLTGPEFQTTAYTGSLAARTNDDSVDTTYYSVSARTAYRATRRLSLLARLTYQNQDTKSATTSSNSDFGDLIGFLGIRYDLDPFHF